MRHVSSNEANELHGIIGGQLDPAIPIPERDLERAREIASVVVSDAEYWEGLTRQGTVTVPGDAVDFIGPTDEDPDTCELIVWARNEDVVAEDAIIAIRFTRAQLLALVADIDRETLSRG